MDRFFRYLLLPVIAGFCLPALKAQPTNGLVAYYSFDGCDAAQDAGGGPAGLVFGNPECGCGVQGNALYLDGVDDHIDFQGSADLLAQDFSASFYIAPENVLGIVDIFSRREFCTPDSAVAIRYEPQTGLLRAELTEGINERGESEAVLPEERCWQHVVWVRSGNSLLLYFNGELVDENTFGGDLDARNDGILSLANSPCLANGEFRYAGAIDEFRVYNRALSPSEVASLYTPIDFIANPDTIIYKGSTVEVSIPVSCAAAYSWVPPSTVTNPDDREPLLQPARTTTYEVTMDYGFCLTSDTLRVIVVDSADIDCETIFFPNVFTPNGDGLNDVFGLSNDNFFLAEFVSFDIFDRWGSKVFSGSDPSDKWDGLFNGERAMPGRYVYKLRYRCNGEDKLRAGSVNLLK